jgi:formylglycine-generating enzyme required for sulfatase activity
VVLKSDFTLPLLEWIKISGGKVILDSGYGTREVMPFTIAKYPTTNAQFQAFIDDPRGYQNEEWWTFSASAQAWHQINPDPVIPIFEGDNMPRESVCWYEAFAFSAWLGHKRQFEKGRADDKLRG